MSCCPRFSGLRPVCLCVLRGFSWRWGQYRVLSTSTTHTPTRSEPHLLPHLFFMFYNSCRRRGNTCLSLMPSNAFGKTFCFFVLLLSQQEVKSLVSNCDGISGCLFLDECVLWTTSYDGQVEAWDVNSGCRSVFFLIYLFIFIYFFVCLSEHLDVSLSGCMFGHLSVFLNVFLSVWMSLWTSGHLYVCLDVCQDICQFEHLSVHLNTCLSRLLFHYLSICLSVLMFKDLKIMNQCVERLCGVFCRTAHLTAHSNRITGCDVSSDRKHFATVSLDLTLKVRIIHI